MREFTPQLNEPLRAHFGDTVARRDAYPVSTFNELVRIVAELSYLNRDNLLFFRGQNEDFRNKAGATTLYPSLYRKNNISKQNLDERFSLLKELASVLASLTKPYDKRAADEIRRRQYIQWSILQHYQVYDTPLLDVTQSLRVACSFAQLEATSEQAYVYVLGLPYMPNGISINSEQEIVDIRLLSVCPPLALRPYFQEGYLVGTTDVTDNYDDKNELDFNRRLIAKFVIPVGDSFWGDNLARIPRHLLFLDEHNDVMFHICNTIRSALLKAEGYLSDENADEHLVNELSAFFRAHRKPI